MNDRPMVLSSRALVCTHATHRTAWRITGGPWHCKVCHPPATDQPIEEASW